MIKFIDPRGKVATPIEPYELSKNVRENEGDRLCLLYTSDAADE